MTPASSPAAYRRQREVEKQTSLSRVTLWRMSKRGEFPQRVQLSPGRVGYVAAEVDAWLEARSQDRSVGGAA